jgi:hypothetical protein
MWQQFGQIHDTKLIQPQVSFDNLLLLWESGVWGVEGRGRDAGEERGREKKGREERGEEGKKEKISLKYSVINL